ncbi:MAG TPA: UvrD-helicase domain-containing protein [Actinoplanes sp.]|jgi:DNA helicase IV|nr:UvrD-helicase domain-containing protein [Actinoplanes sp.]
MSDVINLELAAEQEYFDRAAVERERRRGLVPEIPGVAVNKGAAERSYRYSNVRLEEMAEPTEQVAFGRLDVDENETFYIGNDLIRDSGGEVLVVSWKTKVAAPYYKATAADPLGVRLKRTFQCDDNTIRGFSDVHLANVRAPADTVADASVRPEISDSLLAELRTARTGELRSIVATIQAAQYELIEAPLRQLTIIQGGPGTGKTAVALHRISWLLFNHAEELKPDSVLVVGPSRTFVRYIGALLPGLGDRVAHRSIDDLRPSARVPLRVRGQEPDEVAAVKGDARMAKLLARALSLGLKIPSASQSWTVRTGKETFTLDGAEIAAAVRQAWGAGGTYNQRRMRLRNWFESTALNKRDAKIRWPKPEMAASLTARIIAPASPAGLVQSILADIVRLESIRQDLLTEYEATLLHRKRRPVEQELWTAADIPLLDEADAIINGLPLRYQHIVVDEAQDLSPMQLRALARRSNGSMTVVGDIAQSTGLWARDDWDDLLQHLPQVLPVARHALRYGYRVPRQVHELAVHRAPEMAPGLVPPQPVRDGDEDPHVWQIIESNAAQHVVAQVRRHRADGLSVGVICHSSRRPAVEAALISANIGWSDADRGELGLPVTVASPEGSKGLEFDAVVVLDPASIALGSERGDRLLYIALTRTTQRLDVVDVEPDPEPSQQPTPNLPQQVTTEQETPPTLATTVADPISVEAMELQQRVIELITHDVVERIRATAPAHLWSAVLEAATAALQATSAMSERPPSGSSS